MITTKRCSFAWAAAVSVMLLGCGPGGPPGDDDTDTDTGTGTDTDTDTEYAPTCSWEKVSDEIPRYRIQGFSADEIYALTDSAIIRWDGESWKKHADRQPGVGLGEMFVDDQRNFYFSSASGSCKVRKYGAVGWSCLWSSIESLNVGGAWGPGGEDDVYLVGKASGQPTRIYNHDPGGAWNEVWSGAGSISRIWGRGADDIYAIGGRFGGVNRNQVIHFDGTDWRELPTFSAGWARGGLYDIAADGDGNLWVVGEDRNQYGDPKPFLARYDGSTWKIEVSRGTYPDWDHHESPSGNFTGIHFFADGKGVAVGSGFLYFYDGQKWWEIRTEFKTGGVPFANGRAVWGVSGLDFHVADVFGAGTANESGGLYRGSCQ